MVLEIDLGDHEDLAFFLFINKNYVLGYTLMLLYDHLLTLDSEIDLIWQRKITIPACLFVIFRYATAIVCIINLVAEHDPNWTGTRCSRWVWLPSAIGPIISATTGIILILRVHALYNRAFWILYITVPVYLAQVAVMLWSIPAASVAQFPPGLVGCIPSEKPGTINRLTGSYVASVVFDAIIFLLTLARGVYFRFHNTRIPLVSLLVRDGIMYFLALLFVNLLNVYILVHAPQDLSTMNARFSNLITATLVARLMLNLRATTKHREHHLSTGSSIPHISTPVASPSWMPSAGTLSDMFGMSEFDSYYDDDMRSSGTYTGTGSSRTAVAQAEAWRRGRDLDIELHTFGREGSSRGLLPRDEG